MNYFSVTTVEQWFGEDFVEDFQTAGYILPGPEKYWRFNKIHSYSGRFDSSDEQDLGADSQEEADQGLLVPAGEI